MGVHLYDNLGPKRTNTLKRTAAPPVTTVQLCDGADDLVLTYGNLDALDETVELFAEARRDHVAAMCEGRSEQVSPVALAPDDLVVIDGELMLVSEVVIQAVDVIVRVARKYAGLWDETDTRRRILDRDATVTRLLPTLLAVSS